MTPPLHGASCGMHRNFPEPPAATRRATAQGCGADTPAISLSGVQPPNGRRTHPGIVALCPCITTSERSISRQQRHSNTGVARAPPPHTHTHPRHTRQAPPPQAFRIATGARGRRCMRQAAYQARILGYNLPERLTLAPCLAEPDLPPEPNRAPSTRPALGGRTRPPPIRSTCRTASFGPPKLL